MIAGSGILNSIRSSHNRLRKNYSKLTLYMSDTRDCIVPDAGNAFYETLREAYEGIRPKAI